MMEEPPDEKENVLAKHTRNLLPEVAGGLAGSLVGGPIGGAVGASIGYAAKEVLARILARRQVRRIDEVLHVATARIIERRDAGDAFRQDGFFAAADGRSDAEEVAEGALVTAMSDYEERKTRFYGYLLANIAFESSIDRGLAHSLVRLADRLSYRQLTLLALVAKKSQFDLPSGNASGRVAWSVWSVKNDLDQMGFAQMELLGSEGMPIGSPTGLVLKGEGTLLYNLMELGRIDDSELQELADRLREAYPGGSNSVQ